VRDLWHSLIHSPEAWIIGAVVGVIIAAILDLLPMGESRIRSLIRLVKNKISEHSTAQLEKRIKELEKYRDSLNRMMASDKLLYLGTFRSIFGTLIVMCFGAILLTFRHSVMLVGIGVVTPRAADSLFVLDLSTIFIFSLAGVVAISGVSMTQLDTRQKLEEQIAKYDNNITDLKEVLKKQLENLERRE
jgi:predicted TIM-barrel enzyme